MSRFQILNKNNQPITLGELDKEAAAFFGVEVQDDKYASPENIPYFDWFNWVGRSIANLEGDRLYCDWSDVIGDLCRVQALGLHSVDELIEDINKIRPHIELCLHWKNKGYKPAPR